MFLLLQVFMNNAHDTSLHEMLREVNIELSKRESACGLKQCMEIRVKCVAFVLRWNGLFSLQERLFQKRLFFNPGVNIGSNPD